MLERLRNTLDKGVAAVSVKSESIVESSRIRTAISTAQKQKDDAIQSLGLAFYNSWVDGTLDTETLKSQCERILGFDQEIERQKARLEKLKEEEAQILGAQKKPAESGKFVFCSECGRKLDVSAHFCEGCGTPVNQ